MDKFEIGSSLCSNWERTKTQNEFEIGSPLHSSNVINYLLTQKLTRGGGKLTLISFKSNGVFACVCEN